MKPLFVLALCCALGCQKGTGTEASPRGSLPETPSAPRDGASVAAEPSATTDPDDVASADATVTPSAAPSASITTEPTPSTIAPSQRRAYVVAAVGDSLTGYDAPLGGGYLRALERECPSSRFDNFGKGGAMVNQMRKRFRDQVLGASSPRYSHVIVFGGVNDLYSDLTAHRTNDKIESDLRQMYEWAREGGAKVVAIGVAPWGGFRKYWNERREANTVALNEWIHGELGKTVDHFIDAQALLGCGAKLCPEYEKPFRDGIHFGKEGHAVLGAALKSQVFPDCL